MSTAIHLPDSPTLRRIAVQNFEGGTDIVEADEVKCCIAEKSCIQFWAQIIACAFVMIATLILMVIQGADSKLFYLWEGLFATSFGVLVPSPDYGSLIKK